MSVTTDVTSEAPAAMSVVTNAHPLAATTLSAPSPPPTPPLTPRGMLTMSPPLTPRSTLAIISSTGAPASASAIAAATAWSSAQPGASVTVSAGPVVPVSTLAQCSSAATPRVSTTHSQSVAHTVATVVNRSPTPPPTPPVPGPAAMSIVGPFAQTQTGPTGSSVVCVVGSQTPIAPPTASPPEVPLLPLQQLQMHHQAPVTSVPADVRSRPSSVGTQRRAAYPGYLVANSGRSTAITSSASMPGASTITPRPRSAQSRMGAYAYLPGSSSRQRLATARGRTPAVAAQAPAAPMPQWSARIRRDTTGSPRAASPKGSVASRALSPALLGSPAVSPPREASMSPRSGVREILLPQASRPPLGQRTNVKNGSVSSASGSASGNADSINGKPREQAPPDPWRTRRACQALASLVNRLPDDLLRRVLAVLAEELFNSIFRDYNFSYDPRDEIQNQAGAPPSPDVHSVVRQSSPGRRPGTISSRPPRLCEETLTNAVPYSAVVQSLRDAAKDAIMRRLELEAKCGCSGSIAGEGASPSVDAATSNDAASISRNSVDGLRAGEEVQLREDLRHARLLADTYQARTLELERVRVELEEEVRKARYEREKDAGKKQQLSDEVRRLRQARGVKTTHKGAMPEDGALPLESQVTPRITAQPSLGGGSVGSANNGSFRTAARGGGGNGAGTVSTSIGGSVAAGRRALAEKKSTALGSFSSASSVAEKRASMPASIDGANVEDGGSLAPGDEELPVSRLRRNRTAGEVGVGSKDTVQRGMHTSSAASLTSVDQRAGITGQADAAEGSAGSASKLRKSVGSGSMTTLGATAGSAATTGPTSPRMVRSQGMTVRSPMALGAHRRHSTNVWS